MVRVDRVDVELVRLEPKTLRTDAIQRFVCQETPILRLYCDDGSGGTCYSYTIGTGCSSILGLLHDHLIPRLLGQDPDGIEAIWRDLLFHTHATHVGAITSLALAAIDTALWDRRALQAKLPLWRLAGGAQADIPVYCTEGSWLQLSTTQLVDGALAARAAGFAGAKLKIGRPGAAEDAARLAAVRLALGLEFELMVDANQAFRLSEAMRRAQALDGLGLAWIEEPLPADDVRGHRELCRHARQPVAVGESLYSIGQFAEYLRQDACHVVQVDVARIGGITPWLKVAHLAESHDISVCPHFLMELHVSLACAVPNAAWLEYIPQLDAIAGNRLQLAGLGIDWD